ncbi:MAG: sulfatase-like hydrolase/transferase [Gammaproteobacteria bacterium]|jgi:phosphoglycerol transferase MdoB-like AlkP superfamily enzyme|nr:sulfatase-like hydrolase/transferase [Gammaproteobacteria bacterium]MBT5203206.1 sulfatase-like hydrolase/transferase [Gammaproteobacteria bacterium]MBT5603431.1 sulfatase-like hydrolase/transferase [Gammaproteobacteria bacterium]
MMPNNLDAMLPAKKFIFLQVLLLISLLTVVCGLVFLLSRLFLLVTVFEIEAALQYEDLWQAFLVALRFDIAVVFRVYLLVVLPAIIVLAIPGNQVGLSRFIWTFANGLGYFLITMVVVLSVANIGYIKFFGRPFDSFVFYGLNYGADKALGSIAGLGDFYPALGAMALVGILSWLACRRGISLISRAVSRLHLRRWQFWLIVVSSLLIYLSLGRGSVTTFPLSQKHLLVSSDTRINYLVPNSLVALYYGYREYRSSKNLKPASEQEGRELYTKFYGKSPAAAAIFPQFFTRTPRSELLEKAPPNVVLHLVESMGQGLLLNRFSEGVDLAGALRQHLEQGLYFKHFLPAHNDTQKSVLGLLVNTEYRDVSYSRHQYTAIEASAAQIYKQAGYETIFIYAGFEGIKNRGSYFKRQGFDTFIGANELKRLFPEMAETVWGGEDQYVYDTAIQMLQDWAPGDAPLFIVTLSVTNHPPYTVPEQANTASPKLPPGLQGRLGDLPAVSLQTYRYTNDQLGRFMSQIKHSAPGEQTIVAITGDHAIRGMRYTKEQALHQISVPLYLYLPQRYQAGLPSPDLAQVASHKDLMPTLYALSLSAALYPDLGRNILARTTGPPGHNFAYHSDFIIADGYAYNSIDSATASRWKVDGLDLVSPLQAEFNTERLPASQYAKVLDWLTRYQLVGLEDAGRKQSR